MTNENLAIAFVTSSAVEMLKVLDCAPTDKTNLQSESISFLLPC